MVRKIFLISFLLSCQVFSQAFYNYELKSISFAGNKTFSTSELKTVVLSNETPWWGWKFLHSFTPWGSTPVYFDSSFISVDIISLTDYYHDRGYFSTKITYGVETDTSNKSVQITYIINEGKPERYGKINFIGLSQIHWRANYDFFNEVSFDSTERFFENDVIKRILRGIDILQNNGYMLAAWDSSHAIVDTVKNKIDIDIYITPGKLFTIENFVIEKDGEGKDDVSDELLTDITGINYGENYNKLKIRKSQNRLARTGLFNSIIVEPVVEDTTRNEVPLQIKGNIGLMNELSPDIVIDNYQNYFNLGVGANYTQKNFLDRARKLTIQAKVSVLDILNTNLSNLLKAPDKRDSTFEGTAEFLVKIEQPYVFNRPIFGNIELYIKSLLLTVTTTVTYGGNLSFEFEMPDYTFLNQLKPYFNLEENIFTINDIGLASSNKKRGVFLTQRSLTPLVGVELGASHTNDFFYPSNGFNLSVILETGEASTRFTSGGENASTLSSIGNKETGFFYRTQISSTSYLGLNRNLTRVLAAKIKTGYIQTYSGGSELIPPNKTFFVGGSNSVRGWRARELGPRDSTDFFGVDFSNSPRGGTFLIEGSLELRQKFLESFGAVTFFDFGSTWNGYKKFTFPDVALAVGLGFRYYSPIAPFRIDFGFKFYDPSSKKFLFKRPFWEALQFHFGIGEAF